MSAQNTQEGACSGALAGSELVQKVQGLPSVNHAYEGTVSREDTLPTCRNCSCLCYGKLNNTVI